MNDGDLSAVEHGNLAFAVGDLDVVVDAENVNVASLSEEDFCFGWVCRVGLVVHCQATDPYVVSAGNDKERWRLVVLDPIWHREAQSHKRVLRAT